MRISRLAFCLVFVVAAALSGAEEKKEEKVEIQLVSFEHDFGKKAERLFVIRSTAYRDFAALKKSVPGFSRQKPLVHFVVYGVCDTSSPSFSPKEIEELTEACAKAGIQFTYFPGG
jgi:hypothetical protein